MSKRPERYAYGWDWSTIKGSEVERYWAQQDLASLDALLTDLVPMSRRRSVVQAGACLGIFPRRLAETFAVVHSFEPDAELLAIAQRNAPLPNIRWYPAAVGFERGQVRSVRGRRDGRPNDHEGTTFVEPGGDVPTMRVDDLGLDDCGLIYLDVEGYEYRGLRGAVETLRRCRPVVAVEINRNLALVGDAERDLRSLLYDAGYAEVGTYRSDVAFAPR